MSFVLKALSVATLCILVLTVPVYANVGTGTANAVNYTMQYPIIYIDDKNIQDRINGDIYTYIQAFKDSYTAGDFIDGKFNYETKYEDENYISVIIYEGKWIGGAHEMSNYIGLNYSKRTGENLPLSYFVKLRPEDKNLLYSLCPIYNSKNEPIPNKQLNDNRFGEKISGNYYLLGNGEIALIYQPYQMACFAIGETYIKLTVKLQDYFNRKNNR